MTSLSGHIIYYIAPYNIKLLLFERRSSRWCHQSVHSLTHHLAGRRDALSLASMFSCRRRQLCLLTLRSAVDNKLLRLDSVFFFFLFLSGKLLLYDTTGASVYADAFIFIFIYDHLLLLSSCYTLLARCWCVYKTTIKSIFTRLQLHQHQQQRSNTLKKRWRK